MRVLISSIGSRGDVQPILALALQFQALGHTTVLCVAPNFKAWLESYGVACVPLGQDLRQLTADNAGTRRRPSRAEMRKRVPQSVRESFEVLGTASRGCDLVVVGGGLQTAGRSIAEHLKRPYVYVTYCPVTLPSPHHPPPMIRSQSLPKLANRFLWRSTEWVWNRVFRQSLNEERNKLGLSPVRDVQSHVLTDHPWVAADPVLAPADRAAGTAVTQTGAWFLADPTALPEELQRFLEGGDPPIYFGLGSMAASPKMARLFVEAAGILGRRAVISRGWANLSAMGATTDCMPIDDVNHQLLFPRVAAIVHHGGAGTTTAAALAGKPQVIVPFLYDQHYWSHRVQELDIGVSGPLARTLTRDTLVSALRECLTPQKVGSAEAVANRIELQGARRAAEQLVEAFG